MGMVSVMIKTIMKPAFLTEEIAVDQMSIHDTAQNANALEEEEGAVEELQHLQEEILVIIGRLLMGIVMISTII